jgi:hypothetical protein
MLSEFRPEESRILLVDDEPNVLRALLCTVCRKIIKW